MPCIELRGVGIQLTKLEKCPPVNGALSNFLKCPPVSKSAVNSEGSEKNDTKVETRILEKNQQILVTASSSKRGRGGSRGRGKKNVKQPSNHIGRYFQNQNNNVVCSKCRHILC